MQRQYQILESQSVFTPQVSYDGGNTWASLNGTVCLDRAGAQTFIDNFERKLKESATPYTPSNKEILLG